MHIIYENAKSKFELIVTDKKSNKLKRALVVINSKTRIIRFNERKQNWTNYNGIELAEWFTLGELYK